MCVRVCKELAARNKHNTQPRQGRRCHVPAETFPKFLTGFMTSMNTIIRLKMWTVLPAIHIMNRFMGTDLMGPFAMSQAFCARAGGVTSTQDARAQ